MPHADPDMDAAQRTAWLAALTDTALRDEAGPAVLARGVDIARGDAVLRPALSFPGPGEVALLATIVGTEPYEVGVLLKGGARVALESSCTCPHAEDGFFCKHQVALALRLRAELSGEALPADAAAVRKHAATAKRAATVAARTAALRDFLAGQPSEQLAERLMRAAQQSPELKRELLAWQATASVAGDAKSLGKLVTELLPLRDFLDWRESNAYARSAAQVLPVLQGTLTALAPLEALKLVERAYLRLHKLLERADDSDGQIGDVCAQVGGLWLQALQQAGPQPAAFGAHYAALRGEEVFEAIPHAQAVIAMGEAAARRYGETLRERFEAALAAAAGRKPSRRIGGDFGERDLWSARHDYLEHLGATGDADERLRVLRASLQEDSDHAALIVELQRQGRAREALDCAERANRLFPGRHLIEDRLLAIYEQDGWDAEALALRQARFAREPGAATALAVLKAAAAAKVATGPLREQMWQALQATEAEGLRRWKPQFGWMEAHRPTGPDVTERLRWLRVEGRLDAALALAQPPHGADARELQALALALPAGQHAAAAALLQRVFKGAMAGASSPYTEPLRLVALVVERLPPADAAALLAGLRVQYRAKRNFIAGLPA